MFNTKCESCIKKYWMVGKATDIFQDLIWVIRLPSLSWKHATSIAVNTALIKCCSAVNTVMKVGMWGIWRKEVDDHSAHFYTCAHTWQLLKCQVGKVQNIWWYRPPWGLIGAFHLLSDCTNRRFESMYWPKGLPVLCWAVLWRWGMGAVQECWHAAWHTVIIWGNL